MNPNFKAIYRRAKFKSQHRAGHLLDQEQQKANEQAETQERFDQAFHSGKVVVVEKAKPVKSQTGEDEFDVVNIDEADIDDAETDEAEIDEADEDEADDIQ